MVAQSASQAKAAAAASEKANEKTAKVKPSYKHIPHSQKPPHLVAKRNARERRRVQAVNQAFYKLRKSVPIENRNKRVSKVKTLQRAIDYIRKLERILAEDDEQQLGAAAGADSQVVGDGATLNLSARPARKTTANDCDQQQQQQQQQQQDGDQQPQIMRQRRARQKKVAGAQPANDWHQFCPHDELANKQAAQCESPYHAAYHYGQQPPDVLVRESSAYNNYHQYAGQEQYATAGYLEPGSADASYYATYYHGYPATYQPLAGAQQVTPVVVAAADSSTSAGGGGASFALLQSPSSSTTSSANSSSGDNSSPAVCQRPPARGSAAGVSSSSASQQQQQQQVNSGYPAYANAPAADRMDARAAHLSFAGEKNSPYHHNSSNHHHQQQQQPDDDAAKTKLLTSGRHQVRHSLDAGLSANNLHEQYHHQLHHHHHQQSSSFPNNHLSSALQSAPSAAARAPANLLLQAPTTIQDYTSA